MRKPAADIADIAASVADGNRVDWQALAETTGEPVTLANLKIVAALAAGLRDFDGDTEDEHPDDLAPLPDRWGDLEIRSHIESGASADVLLAHDPALGRDVALKLFRQAETVPAGRLLAEGRLLARIDHPNVVRVYGAATHDGKTGLWMERIDGRSLHELVTTGPLPGDREAALMGLDVARGLAAVHAAGVIHGDIKAANVLRDAGGRVRIADFGSGIDARAGETPLRISGTPLYLAPEVVAGETPSVASDIYSLGVLLFFLLSGRYPVEAGSIDDLRTARARQVDRQSLRDLRPELDEALQRIIERCLASEPSARPASAGAVAEQLSACLAGSDIPDGARAGRQVESRVNRRAWIGAAAAALLLPAAWLGFRAPDYTLDLDLRVARGGSEQPAVAIGDGGTVRPGDRLALAVTSDRPLYFYIVSESDAGRSWGLFPLVAPGAGNPVAAGPDRRLPADGWWWQVSEAAATETLHIVASPEPVPGIAAAYAELPAPEMPGAGEAGGFAPRGIGRVVRAASVPAAPAGTASLLAAIAAAREDADRETGISYRRITLRHAAAD